MRDVLEIGTERLTLRSTRCADAQRLARYASDSEVARMVARVPSPYFTVAAEGWILMLRARASLGEEFVFAMDLPGEGLIGVIGAHKLQSGAFEIGYWIGRPYWGLGYGTEALAAFLAEARKLGALEAGHFIDNPASGRVLEKAGFVYTGETRPVFSLGRGENATSRRMQFKPKRRPEQMQAQSFAACC